MGTPIPRTEIFTDKNYKISRVAFKKVKKELDLTNKIEIGACIPKDIYSKLTKLCECDGEKDDVQKAHMFVSNFEQILSTSLDRNMSANYRSLRPSNDKRYLKINLTFELNELFKKYSELLLKLYDKVLYINPYTNKPACSDTEINIELRGINYFLGINEFPTYSPDNYTEDDIQETDTQKIELQEEEDIVDEDYASTYEMLYNYYKKHSKWLILCKDIYEEQYKKIYEKPYEELSEELHEELFGDFYEIFIDNLIRDSQKPDEIYWKMYNHNFQQKLYSILIRKIENDHKRLDEDKLKKIQAHHSNSEELILFVTASTYKWLNTFKGQFSLSINEIAYYFVYERLKKMVAYMKELEKATNEELNDRIIKEPNAFTDTYINDKFLRHSFFKKYINDNFRNVSIYREYVDIGIVLSLEIVDKFYKAFMNYKKINPTEILPNDYLNFLLKDYFEPRTENM